MSDALGVEGPAAAYDAPRNQQPGAERNETNFLSMPFSSLSFETSVFVRREDASAGYSLLPCVAALGVTGSAFNYAWEHT